ncbi:DgyrCDS6481 [Dimorphilus gyrociliatus]|uniref:DgyrCDS6481 n=1 Tax=Dimorphilus gyrociliatus TaxID=2664684 RepID=A0A7I8VQH4_9ANNE|nr:DgyrCDS6481 [Dimorphilus gyrociliatus]
MAPTTSAVTTDGMLGEERTTTVPVFTDATTTEGTPEPTTTLPVTTTVPITTTEIVTTTTIPATTTVPTTTAPLCHGSLVQTDCVCQKTCESLADSSFKCPTLGSDSCNKGCHCGAGYVMHNSKCIKETECPCFANNRYYQFGEKFALEEKCMLGICTAEKGIVKMVDPTCQQDKCTLGRVWSDCACEKTCENPKRKCDMVNCKPGCACKEGTFWNGEKCAPQTECQCKKGDKLYSEGERWNVGQCVRCKCENGQEICSEYCPLTEEDCKKKGKKLVNNNLEDKVCCSCVADEPQCMDESGVSRSVGSIWHKGVCDMYECVLLPGGSTMVKQNHTTCTPCRQGETPVYSPKKCCPECKEPLTTTTTSTTTTATTPGTTTSTGTTTELVTGGHTPEPDTTTGTTTVSTTETTTVSTIGTTTEQVTGGHSEEPSTTGTTTTAGTTTGTTTTAGTTTGTTTTASTSTAGTTPGTTTGTTTELVTGGHTEEPSTTPATTTPQTTTQGTTTTQTEETTTEGTTTTPTDATTTQGTTPATTTGTTTELVTGGHTEEPVTTTAAAPTTTGVSTTEAPVTKPPTCAEAMSKDTVLTDDLIDLSPEGTVDDLRPNGSGWKVDKTSSPSITVDLTPDDKDGPTNLEQITLKGNVEDVKILVKKTPEAEFETVKDSEGDVEFDATKPIRFTEVLKVYSIRIVLLDTIEDTDTTYLTTLSVHACVKVPEVKTCKYNGKDYDFNSEWFVEKSGIKTCVKCNCNENGVNCDDMSKNCNLKCDGELVYQNGTCCPVCKPKKQSCSLKTVNTVLEVGECKSANYVKRTMCVGSCSSGATAMFTAPYMKAVCNCCKPVAMEKAVESLTCKNGTTIEYNYVKIQQCSCNQCSYNPFA